MNTQTISVSSLSFKETIIWRFNPDFSQVTNNIGAHLYPVMVNGIRARDLPGSNNERSSKFRVASRIRQETPEEGWRVNRLKRCEYNNKNEDNNPKTLNVKNH